MWRILGVVVVAFFPSRSVSAVPFEVPPSARTRGECLSAPVARPLVAGFVAPPCPFCAGRRTVGFGATAGDLVRSPVGGRIHFSGAVAGLHYITIVPASDPSMLVTIGGAQPAPEMVGAIAVGSIVAAGRGIGVATGPVVLSLRRRYPSGDRRTSAMYLDPEPYLARWRVPARLIALKGTSGRPAGASFGCRQVLGDGAATRRPR